MKFLSLLLFLQTASSVSDIAWSLGLEGGVPSDGFFPHVLDIIGLDSGSSGLDVLGLTSGGESKSSVSSTQYPEPSVSLPKLAELTTTFTSAAPTPHHTQQESALIPDTATTRKPPTTQEPKDHSNLEGHSSESLSTESSSTSMTVSVSLSQVVQYSEPTEISTTTAPIPAPTLTPTATADTTDTSAFPTDTANIPSSLSTTNPLTDAITLISSTSTPIPSRPSPLFANSSSPLQTSLTATALNPPTPSLTTANLALTSSIALAPSSNLSFPRTSAADRTGLSVVYYLTSITAVLGGIGLLV